MHAHACTQIDAAADLDGSVNDTAVGEFDDLLDADNKLQPATRYVYYLQ